MSLSVKILGSGAAIPTLNRGNTAQFVSCKDRYILIDCGEGTQIQMRKFKVKFQQIQIILISHLHGDHIFGLPSLISTMQLLGRINPITIIGPKGIKKYLNSQLNVSGNVNGFPIHYTELQENAVQTVFEDRCIEIKTFPLNHRIPTQGYRINEKPGKRHLNKEAFDKTGISVAYIQKLINGENIEDNNGILVKSNDVTFPPDASKSYAFCSDTAYFPEIIAHIKEVDILYHEATFIDKEAERATQTYHSTAKQAAAIALKANVKCLILGHFSARYRETDLHLSEAQEIFEKTFVPIDGELFYG